MKRNLFSIAIAILLFSCSENKQSEVHTPINDTFSTEQKTSTETVDLGSQTSQWIATDSTIICKTEDDNAVYAILDKETLQKTSDFGKIGHGNKEWINPFLIAANGNNIIVADNGTRKIYNVAGGKIEDRQKLAGTELLNDPKSISYPIIGYVAMSPKSMGLKITNIEQMQTIDSICFTSKDGNSQIYEFAWACHDSHIVIANQHANQFILCTLDGDKHIKNKEFFEGKAAFDENKVFYTDAACDNNFVYLLSQKQVNMEDGSGHSEIEIYDFNGKPQRKLVLDFIAFKMLLDNNRLLLTSVADDCIHVARLK